MILTPHAHGIGAFHRHPVSVTEEGFLHIGRKLIIHFMVMDVSDEASDKEIRTVIPVCNLL